MSVMFFKAVNFADQVIVDGYEMDTFEWKEGVLETCLCDEKPYRFRDQEIQLIEGKALVEDVDGWSWLVAFNTYVPLTEEAMQ